MVQELGGRAAFAVENYGDSELARASGVTRYPAIFVDDVLVATPKDFGFFGKGEGPDVGRYAPIRSAASHERFRADLRRMIDLVMAGKRDLAEASAASTDETLAPFPSLGACPSNLPRRQPRSGWLGADYSDRLLVLTDLDGRAVRADELAGRPVLVELWATWCPPCRGTLSWLGELKERHGDRLAVLAIAVESDEADVRKTAARIASPLRFIVGTPEIVRAFGDVSAVPTALLFDGKGAPAGAYYGTPPGLHRELEARVDELLVP